MQLHVWHLELVIASCVSQLSSSAACKTHGLSHGPPLICAYSFHQMSLGAGISNIFIFHFNSHLSLTVLCHGHLGNMNLPYITWPHGVSRILVQALWPYDSCILHSPKASTTWTPLLGSPANPICNMMLFCQICRGPCVPCWLNLEKHLCGWLVLIRWRSRDRLSPFTWISVFTSRCPQWVWSHALSTFPNFLYNHSSVLCTHLVFKPH